MIIRKITPVNKKDIKKFIQFPFDLYKKSPLWVPQLQSDIKNILRRKHPFFEHSIADFFIAEKNDRTIGRIAVINNRRANEFRNRKTAFFGYFETIDDNEVTKGLFDTAFDWSRCQGLDSLIGPRGMIGSDSGGILVEGFEYKAALGVPYNPPYYDRLIREIGFTKDTDHLSGYLPGNHPIPDRILRIAEKIKNQRRFWVKSFSNKEELWDWVPKVQDVHREAFEGTHTFFPPSENEMILIADSLISIADPDLIKLLLDGDKVIGFIFAYHDISAGLRKSKGKIWPLGWFYILRERNRNEWVNINGVGILPKYQGLGGNAILYTEIDKSVKAFGFKHIDVVQVNEANYNSFKDMEAIGVKWYKKHRSYKIIL